MYASHELSQAVRTRRKDIGLSQQALAELSGLSRSTVIDVEKGVIKDLSLTRTAALLDAIGLGLTVSPAHPRLQSKVSSATPLELASRTASVSYASPVTPQILGEALSTGKLSTAFEPHVSTLLEEAPISLLAKAVEQVHLQSDIPRKKVWQNMRQLAEKFKATREFWCIASLCVFRSD
jgi:transcriptional regulator with XRE-family HTH domain